MPNILLKNSSKINNCSRCSIHSACITAKGLKPFCNIRLSFYPHSLALGVPFAVIVLNCFAIVYSRFLGRMQPIRNVVHIRFRIGGHYVKRVCCIRLLLGNNRIHYIRSVIAVNKNLRDDFAVFLVDLIETDLADVVVFIGIVEVSCVWQITFKVGADV